MNCIDLRSDTFTFPTQEMRDAMHIAEVGNQEFGDDPNVNELEKLAAEMVGKEAAIFCPSGVFANQCAVKTHVNENDRVLIGKGFHIQMMEGGVNYVNVDLHEIDTESGVMDLNEIQKCINDKTTLLLLENPHLSSGLVVPIEKLRSMYKFAKENNLNVHMDGARIFNAQAYSGVSVKQYAECCDSLMFCLSKGLCSPMGSILVGSQQFIQKATIVRKKYGGTMRQTGIVASAGLISLKKHVNYLKKDLEMAIEIVKYLQTIPEIEVKLEDIQYNIFYFTMNGSKNPQQLMSHLEKDNIKIMVNYKNPEDKKVRWATHYYIREKEVQIIIESLKKFFN